MKSNDSRIRSSELSFTLGKNKVVQKDKGEKSPKGEEKLTNL